MKPSNKYIIVVVMKEDIIAMLNKNFFLLISSVTIVLLIYSGCKKYPDGPSFSLRSKLDRVANEWKPESIIENEIDATAEFQDFLLDIQMNGEASWHYQRSTITTNLTGNWEFFDNSKQIRFNWANSTTDELFVLRLTKDELWLEDEIDTISVIYKLVPN